MRSWIALMLGAIATASCAAASADRPSGAVTERSILAGSTPSAGSTVAGPIDVLKLRFDPPARLLEVTISDGAGQAMPMMVHAAGEARDYSLPLPGLEPGSYRVDWRARAGTLEQAQSFVFAVR